MFEIKRSRDFNEKLNGIWCFLTFSIILVVVVVVVVVVVAWCGFSVEDNIIIHGYNWTNSVFPSSKVLKFILVVVVVALVVGYNIRKYIFLPTLEINIPPWYFVVHFVEEGILFLFTKIDKNIKIAKLIKGNRERERYIYLNYLW